MKETCLTQSTTVANLTTEFLRKFAHIERRNEKNPGGKKFRSDYFPIGKS